METKQRLVIEEDLANVEFETSEDVEVRSLVMVIVPGINFDVI